MLTVPWAGLATTAELRVPVPVAESVPLTGVPAVVLTEPLLAVGGVPPPPLAEQDVGLNLMSSTGCSSMALGATPVWPCWKSKKPMPFRHTGMLAVLKDVVAEYLLSNSERAVWM